MNIRTIMSIVILTASCGLSFAEKRGNVVHVFADKELVKSHTLELSLQSENNREVKVLGEIKKGGDPNLTVNNPFVHTEPVKLRAVIQEDGATYCNAGYRSIGAVSTFDFNISDGNYTKANCD